MILVNSVYSPSRVAPEYLSALRMVFALWVLYESLGLQFQLFSEVGGTDYTVTVFPAWLDELIAGSIFPLLLALQISSIVVLAGLFARTSTWVLAILYLLVYSFHYSYFDAPVPWLYGWFPLLILALSRCGETWSVDSWISGESGGRFRQVSERYGWPLDAMRMWFVYIYASAGISKLFPLSDVSAWIANSPTQEILVFRYPHSMAYYLFDRPLFDYSSSAELIALGALGVMALEVSVLIMVFTDRFDLVFLALIFLMHGLLWLVGVPNFGLASLVLMSAIVARKVGLRISNVT